MESKYTGGCLCGEVRYATDAEPIFSANCHCKDCQRSSGGPFTPVMMFPEAAVSMTGTARYFRLTGDSGRAIERGFCPNCGAQLFTKLEAVPGGLGVKAGTLDDAAKFKPTMDIYVSSAQPWGPMNPELPKRSGSPRD
jgi:hypothetical protein